MKEVITAGVLAAAALSLTACMKSEADKKEDLGYQLVASEANAWGHELYDAGQIKTSFCKDGIAKLRTYPGDFEVYAEADPKDGDKERASVTATYRCPDKPSYNITTAVVFHNPYDKRNEGVGLTVLTEITEVTQSATADFEMTSASVDYAAKGGAPRQNYEAGILLDGTKDRQPKTTFVEELNKSFAVRVFGKFSELKDRLATETTDIDWSTRPSEDGPDNPPNPPHP